MKSLVVPVVTLTLAACASSPEARRAEEAQRIRCASIDIFPMGVSPGRPYRVLGPLSVDGGARSGEQALRDRACSIGADAVVDYRREAPIGTPSPGQFGDAPADHTLLTGTAVAYTDVVSSMTAPSTAPPPEATAVGTPPPQ
jgi:hypothetical protein